MGIKGLWKLFNKYGYNITFEDLRCWRIGIDASMLLNSSKSKYNSHRKSIITKLKIIKILFTLLTYDIRPIFVIK